MKELESVTKHLANVERELENEVVKRSDYENRIKTIQNDLSLQAQVHKKVVQQLNWLLEHDDLLMLLVGQHEGHLACKN